MNEEHIFMKAENRFSQIDFENPGLEFAPVYGWAWNAQISREETRKQLEEMQRLGVRAIYVLPLPKGFRPNSIPTMLEPDFLTKAYFEEFQYAYQEAEKLGMTMWLYDEGGWPSGGACGKVLLEYPEYARRSLASREVTLNAGEIYTVPEDTAAAFTEDGDSVENEFSSERTEKITEYYEKVTLFDRPGMPDFPDLSRKEAVEAFIEIGLEPYKPYLKELFGKGITAVFTDEPTLPRAIPFRAELAEEFERRNGYSILPYLPYLAGNREVNEEAAMACIAWQDMCSDLFCKNFLLTEKKWANENGMSFTGHMDVDDKIHGCIRGGNFHILRALRTFDMPGIDVIWRQIFPLEEPSEWNPVTGVSGENRFFPRYASSAAAQIGSKRAMTESFGVYGAGLTFDEMRYMLNFQAVRGINVFNLFSIPYARKGHLMTGELPLFTEKHACYGDLPVLNQYLERLSYIISLGKSANPVALYAPMWDLWAGESMEYYADQFEKTGKEMEDGHILFDVFDDDVLEQAEDQALACGEIRMGDAKYTTLVIPPCKYIPELTVKKLEQFACGGGKLYMISCENMPVIKGAIAVESIMGKIASPLTVSGDTRLLRAGGRIFENGRVFFIYNERVTEAAFGVSLADTGCEFIYLLDLNSGKINMPHYEDGEIKLRLASGDMAVLLCMEEAVSAEPTCAFKSEEEIKTPFTFRRTNRFIIGEKTYISEDISEEEQAIKLGDWSDKVGKEFSGSGIYKTVFALPESKDTIEDCTVDCDKKVYNKKGIYAKGFVCLDLGEVHYTCEAFLNGHSLGVRVMAPYRYEIPVRMLQEENVLEIRVSNTPANEYNYTKSFDKWQEWQLSPYWPREKVYQEDSLSGGLYGPVKLCFEE